MDRHDRGRMLEIRMHGRGGQGTVSAAEVLSVAAFLDGDQAQAFPMFGSERMGAPVLAFCRIADAAITTREPVSDPDVVIVADATLLHHVDVFAGLRPDGFVLVNSVRSAAELGLAEQSGARSDRVAVVAASDIARAELGRPLPNICLLGALVAITAAVTMPSLAVAVRERFHGDVAEGNVRAAYRAYEQLKERDCA